MINQKVYNFSGVYKLIQEAASESFFENMEIKIQANDLLKIPKTGSFVTVCNRPVGAIEELILARIVHPIRPDYFFLENQFLKDLTEFRNNFMAENNVLTLKDITNNGNGVGVFPVGNISDFQNPYKAATDSKWDKVLIKKVEKTQAVIIPIYIKIEDDSIFKTLSRIHPILLTRKVLANIISKNGLKATVSIGKPIKPNNYKTFQTTSQLSRFLRAKVYAQRTKLHIDSFYQNELPAVAPAIETTSIEKELAALTDTNRILSQSNFEVFLVKAKKIPNTIVEIGRLREETFRAVGEGTAKEIDLDEFDLHYLHLFVWDKEARKIAGAYRIGVGDYIMKTMGSRGFYLRTLFKMKKEFNPVLEQSIELGRSFVTSEYQNKRLPLFLLWKGIATFLMNHSHVSYLIGPVSISNDYSNFSRSLIVQFIKRYHWNTEFADMVKPLKAFKPNFEGIDAEILLDSTNKNIKLMDDIIEDSNADAKKVPILLKKYFNQNAKIIGFNIDPNFSNALDGFMITKTKEIPKQYFEN